MLSPTVTARAQALLRSPHSLFGLAVLLLLGLALIAARTVVIDHLLERSQRYGQAMANIAAKRAIDATLNHDLVSLQVILQDVVANPDVAQAAIFDVENNLLVQSGGQRSRGERDYIAAITLQDSIAGYVAVALSDEGRYKVVKQLYGLFALLAALILGFTMVVAYWRRESPESASIAIPIVETPKEITPKPSGSSPLSKVELLLYFPALAQLQRQLNNARFTQLVEEFNEHLAAVASLYSGRIIAMELDQARIGFSALAANSECAFNGLCSAHLLQGLAKISDFPLDVSAAVFRNSADATATVSLLQRQRVLEKLVAYNDEVILVAEPLAGDANLCERIATIEGVEDFELLDDFRSSYRNLLEQQLQQLKSQPLSR